MVWDWKVKFWQQNVTWACFYAVIIMAKAKLFSLFYYIGVCPLQPCLFSGKVDTVSQVENWLGSQWQKAETLSTLATLLSHVYRPFELSHIFIWRKTQWFNCFKPLSEASSCCQYKQLRHKMLRCTSWSGINWVLQAYVHPFKMHVL